jgi:hypothetical protein
MFTGGGGLFDDGDLLGGIDRYVNDLDLRLTEQLFDAGIDFRDSMFFSGTLCLLTIPVRDADDSEPSLLVGGQMRIVDDPSGAHNTDAVIQASRQFGFVFEVRKGVSHFRIPWDAIFVSGQQSTCGCNRKL